MRSRVCGWGNFLHYTAIALPVRWCSCTQLRKRQRQVDSSYFIICHRDNTNEEKRYFYWLIIVCTYYYNLIAFLFMLQRKQRKKLEIWSKAYQHLTICSVLLTKLVQVTYITLSCLSAYVLVTGSECVTSDFDVLWNCEWIRSHGFRCCYELS